MASTTVKTRYILAEDHDIQGKIWHKGDSVYCIMLEGPDEPRCDLFLTHRAEYARRGSRVPVHRTLVKYLVITGETLRIENPDADDQL